MRDFHQLKQPIVVTTVDPTPEPSVTLRLWHGQVMLVTRSSANKLPREELQRSLAAARLHECKLHAPRQCASAADYECFSSLRARFHNFEVCGRWQLSSGEIFVISILA